MRSSIGQMQESKRSPINESFFNMRCAGSTYKPQATIHPQKRSRNDCY